MVWDVGCVAGRKGNGNGREREGGEAQRLVLATGDGTRRELVQDTGARATVQEKREPHRKRQACSTRLLISDVSERAFAWANEPRKD